VNEIFTEEFQILHSVKYDSFSTIRTNECTRFYWSHNITTHQLLHVAASLPHQEGAHSAHAEHAQRLFCAIVCNLVIGQWGRNM